MMPLDKHRGIITLHPQLDILPAQPLQLRALALAHRGVAVCLAAAFPGTPVTQRALVDAQLPGHLRDRLARLEHQPHRALLKILIELPVLPCHRSSSKRCLHITRGSPGSWTRPGVGCPALNRRSGRDRAARLTVDTSDGLSCTGWRW